MTQREYVTMRLDDLLDAEYNPRTITDDNLERLGRSIQEFGLVQPIIFNKRTGNIVGGHQRARAMRAAGEEEVDVVVVDLDEGQEKQLNVALNSPNLQGAWDDDALKEVLAEIDRSGFDVGLTGFELGAIAAPMLDIDEQARADRHAAEADAHRRMQEEMDEGIDLSGLNDIPDAMDVQRESMEGHTRRDILAFGKVKLTMTPEETKDIALAYKRYVRQMATDYGFIRHLLAGELVDDS